MCLVVTAAFCPIVAGGLAKNTSRNDSNQVAEAVRHNAWYSLASLIVAGVQVLLSYGCDTRDTRDRDKAVRPPSAVGL